jgi:hypothetical protein
MGMFLDLSLCMLTNHSSTLPMDPLNLSRLFRFTPSSLHPLSGYPSQETSPTNPTREQ